MLDRATLSDELAAAARVVQKPEQVPQAELSAPATVRVPPRLGSSADILALQQTVGNRAVMRILAARRPSAVVQAKLADDAEEESVQRREKGLREPSSEEIHAAAARGVNTPATILPYLDRIQASFGSHPIGHIKAHIGAEASQAARAMNALAFASGDHVVFGGTPDLRTVAHEAAHVVQQQAGVQLAGGIGREGDAYERHADAVADSVAIGQSAGGLLGSLAPSTGDGSRAESQAIQRKFTPSEHEPNVYVWKDKDGLSSGRYRFLLNSVDKGKIFYLNLDHDLAIDLNDIDSAKMKLLLQNGAIVYSGKNKNPTVAIGLSGSDIESIVQLLKQEWVPSKKTSIEFRKMNFRFPSAIGFLYYTGDNPPVEPKEHPNVKFVPTTRETLEDIRASESNRAHYSDRVNMNNWVYERAQVEQPMLSRKEKSIFQWGNRPNDKTHNASEVSESMRKDIVARMLKLARPSSQTVRLIGQVTYKDRDGGQAPAMGHVNAAAYALAVGDRNASNTDWQWLHVRGASLGGSTEPSNLVCGTDAANSHMIAAEHDLVELSRRTSSKQPLEVWFGVTTKEGTTHMGEKIEIGLIAPNGLTDSDGAQIINNNERTTWRFYPRTGAIIDRLDRDLQWGISTVSDRAANLIEPSESVTLGLTDPFFPLIPQIAINALSKMQVEGEISFQKAHLRGQFDDVHSMSSNLFKRNLLAQIVVDEKPLGILIPNPSGWQLLGTANRSIDLPALVQGEAKEDRVSIKFYNLAKFKILSVREYHLLVTDRIRKKKRHDIFERNRRANEDQLDRQLAVNWGFQPGFLKGVSFWSEEPQEKR